jgi:flagellar assembly protein FliH
MAIVIPGSELEEHNINKYSFKVIALGTNEDEHKTASKDSLDKETASKPNMAEVDSSALSSSSKESLIESLMQKTDEMSSNFIKLQMKLESKEEEYQVALAKAKDDAYAEGLAAGMAKALSDTEANTSKNAEMFASSISKLEESAEEFKTALEGIKSELISAALDIAKEVIKVELSTNSNEVAKLLCDELMKDLQSASQVTLKVNPLNHGALSEHVGKLEHINVVSDSAVSEGGVIVISDAGNVDAQISKRFERVKRVALSE